MCLARCNRYIADNLCIHTVNISVNNIGDVFHVLRNKLIFMRATLIRLIFHTHPFFELFIMIYSKNRTSSLSCHVEIIVHENRQPSERTISLRLFATEFYSVLLRKKLLLTLKMRYPGQPCPSFIFIDLYVSDDSCWKREISETRSLLALSRNPFIYDRRVYRENNIRRIISRKRRPVVFPSEKQRRYRLTFRVH